MEGMLAGERWIRRKDQHASRRARPRVAKDECGTFSFSSLGWLDGDEFQL